MSYVFTDTLDIWGFLDTLTGPTSLIPGDLDSDGDADEDVDGGDFLVWQNEFGTSIGGPTGNGNAAVPETAAVWMAAILAMLAGGFSKRHTVRK